MEAPLMNFTEQSLAHQLGIPTSDIKIINNNNSYEIHINKLGLGEIKATLYESNTNFDITPVSAGQIPNNLLLTDIPGEINLIEGSSPLNYSFLSSIGRLPASLRLITKSLDFSIFYNNLVLFNITKIFVNNYKIENIYSLTKLKYLKELHLDSCGLKDVKKFSGFTNLEKLVIVNNNINSIEDFVALSNLKYLDISRNNIKSISSIDYLIKNRKLKEFYFFNNPIDTIPKTIYELSHKNMFSATSIKILKTQVVKFQEYELAAKLLDLEKIVIRGGSIPDNLQDSIYNNFDEYYFLNDALVSPPIDTFQKGKASVKSWYERFEREIIKGTQPLNEAKLVLIGEPFAGKTSLVDYLMDRPYSLTPTTNGVNLNQWYIYEKGEYFRFNIWDFGGQEIQSTVHQFFLTKDTLYIIVLNARQDAKFAERYIEQIKSFAPDSPIIIVINKIDENPSAKIEENRLKETYKDRGNDSLIKAVHKISLLEGYKNGTETHKSELECLKSTIIKELQSLPNIKKEVPNTYINTKNHIENYFSNVPYISYESYTNICLNNNLSVESNDDLLYYLDILGTIRYFDDLGTRHLQILKPEWLTSGIYRIITSEYTSQSFGIIKTSDLEKILKTTKGDIYKYPKQYYQFLIEMIKIFNIGYYNIENETIFIPYAFSTDYPDLFRMDDYKNDAIHFYFKYEAFIPSTLISSFIAQVFSQVKGNLFWHKGIVIEKFEQGEVQTALIIENTLLSRIDIWVQGKYRRDFFVEIRSIFSSLHDKRKGLVVDEWISLNDEGNISVKYDLLIAYASIGIPIYIDEKRNKYKVDILLGMFESEQILKNIYDIVNQTLVNTNKIIIQASDIHSLIENLDSKIESLSEQQSSELLTRIDEQMSLLPASITKDWKAVNQKPADYREVKGKLKATIPIIPTILNYETEISIDLRNSFKKIWEDLKNGNYFIEKNE